MQVLTINSAAGLPLSRVPGWAPLRKDDTVIYSGIAEIAMGNGLVFSPKPNRKTFGKIAPGFHRGIPGKYSQYMHNRSAFGLNTRRNGLRGYCFNRY
jgi:hypothetical protein